MATAAKSLALELCTSSDQRSWDAALLRLPDAHPLQTWAWGEAKQAMGELVDRIMIRRGGEPLLLAQVFRKEISPLRVATAWIPRGPAASAGADPGAFTLLKRGLQQRGYRLALMKPYMAAVPWGRVFPWRRERTFIVDLTVPTPAYEKKLHKEWRYGKNRFLREGGVVREDQGENAAETLIDLYDRLAARKDFHPYGNAEFIRRVWTEFGNARVPGIGAHLFCAELNGRCLASALVLRVGDTAHYHWGAFDYEARKLRVNEGIQWGIMERLRALGVKRYDLEGADAHSNPGVFDFKRRMGGELISLPALRAVWLW